MEAVTLIVTILSGLFGAFYALKFLITICEAATYKGSRRELQDTLRGVTTVFYPGKPLALAVILLTIFFVLL